MTLGHTMTASNFVQALTQGNYHAAHALLSAEAKLAFPPAELEEKFKDMTGQYGGPAVDVQVMQELTSWPDKRPDDLGWVYISLSGATFSEAVAVVVSRENGEDVIRSIEWGRP